MLNQDNRFMGVNAEQTQATTYDAGLRQHMVRVYNTVAAGLAISGVTAYAISTVPALYTFFMNPIVSIAMMIGLIAFLMVGMSPAKAMNQSVGTLQGKYYLFTAVLGASLSYIFVAYTDTSIIRVFFITAATFAGTSLLGYTTKRDLTGMGSFLMMGVIGIILASVVNFFLKSSGLHFAISIIGVLVFTGLIAFESQQAKRIYSSGNDDATNHKMAIFSALSLYISFINLFQFLLSLMGSRS